MRRVLVTGMSGLIGAAVRRRLEGRFALRALNRRPVAGVESHQADIADLEAIAPAFRDVDAVVHLAANVEANPPIDRVVRDN
ncbi:MAG: NAD-dependent epimerase/dehydratase family protein, partial [Candidatus Rokuibacteriota bacterium]